MEEKARKEVRIVTGGKNKSIGNIYIYMPNHIIKNIQRLRYLRNTGSYRVSEKEKEPKLIGGIGEINFGKQWRQGNRIYDSLGVAMAITAEPLGNAGGYSYLYMTYGKHKQGTERNIEEKQN